MVVFVLGDVEPLSLPPQSAAAGSIVSVEVAIPSDSGGEVEDVPPPPPFSPA